MTEQAKVKKVKLDFNFKILDLDGNPTKIELQDGTVQQQRPANKILGNLMMRAIMQDENKITKYFDWARELNQLGTLEVDRADVKEIKDFIIDHKELFNLAKAQMLQKFEE